MSYQVLLFYQYVPIDDPKALRVRQLHLCAELGLKGRIIVAAEGINGTLGGKRRSIEAYIQAMRRDARFKSIDFKISPGSVDAFPRLSVKVRPEIVTLAASNEPDFSKRAQHLDPAAFHELIQLDDVVILDARNRYEWEIGKFKRALTLDIELFKQFPHAIQAHTNQLKDKKVAMYCTGGVRCEKASALLKEAGIEEVYQLAGGIQRYGEQYPDGEWEGEMFVFDGRQKVAFKDAPERLGSCRFCAQPTNDHQNCAHKPCNLLFLVCSNCRLTNSTCSKTCRRQLSVSAVG